MKDARQIAYEALLRFERDKAYSNMLVDSALDAEKPNETESSFATFLIYTTLENLLTLDYNISLYLRQDVGKLRSEILSALRLGACQILFSDKVPLSAAVNESVKIIKKTKAAYASGFVNAVLRNISKNGLRLPDPKEDELQYLSIKFSVPVWLIKLWQNSYGIEKTNEIIGTLKKRPPLYLRVNKLKNSAESLVTKLCNSGIEAEVCTGVEYAVAVNNAGKLWKSNEYLEGLFYVQDLSSQIFCDSLNIKAGQAVLDLCAAPGGKTFTVAQQTGLGGIVKAYDIHANRVALIKEGAKRLGFSNVDALVGDASVFNPDIGWADMVICDVPCSGFGVLRRKPEVRYKTADSVDNLPELQYRILVNASNYVSDSGLLVYSTCTLNPQENEEVCKRFLKENPLFSEQVIDSFDNGFGRTIFPQDYDSDGFFYFLFRKAKAIGSI